MNRTVKYCLSMAKSLIRIGSCIYAAVTGNFLAIAFGFIAAEAIEVSETVMENLNK